MKKNLISMVLLIALVAALMVTFTGCGGQSADSDAAARIAELEAENAQLKEQVNKLTAQLQTGSQKAGLKDWTLDAAAWSDGNGATVTFTAVPLNYAEGMKAALSIRMGDLEAESTNCNWDGSAFTGSVELSAADGYSYFCILTSPDGSLESVELNSPQNTTNETLVYLGSSLSAYANMIVEDWEATAASLNIKSGYVQCQMPRMDFNNVASGITKAELVMKLDGTEQSRQEITLEPGEGEGSFECMLENITFAMPTTAEDYQLDLGLEVTLDTGSTVSVTGGSWYSSNGDLQLVVG